MNTSRNQALILILSYLSMYFRCIYSSTVIAGSMNIPKRTNATRPANYPISYSDCHTLIHDIIPASFWASGGYQLSKSIDMLPNCCGMSRWKKYIECQDNRIVGLKLSRMGFSGGLSPKLGMLEKLTKLVLSHNDLNGQLPTQLGNLVNLKMLDLSFNKFTGRLPRRSLASLTSLETLVLSHNRLTGELPTHLGKLVNLKLFDLSFNKFLCKLDNNMFMKMSNIKQLILSTNKFIGHVPWSLALAPSLQHIAIDNNYFSKNLHRFFTRRIELCTGFTMKFNPQHSVPLPQGVKELSQQEMVSHHVNTKSNVSKIECIICREEIQGSDLAVKGTRCGHIFHKQCLQTWLQEDWLQENSLTCPKCRTSMS